MPESTTFSAFFVCGLAPILRFVFKASSAFMLSTVLTGIVFFAIGSLKNRWSTISRWRSVLTTLVVGSTASALAHATGVLLEGLEIANLKTVNAIGLENIELSIAF